MPLINYEINLDLNWSKKVRYISAVALSTQDNAKLLEHLKFGF